MRNLVIIAGCFPDDVVMAHFFSSMWQGPWFNASEWPPELPSPSATQWQWLTEAGSLTARLKAQPAQFSLDVIQQTTQRFPAELLPQWSNQTGLLREIAMSLDGQACVFAQSFLPSSTIEAFAPLASLGNLPLGEFIFQQAELRRYWLEVAWFEQLKLTANWTVYGVFARRSLYALQQHEFLVQEVFLREMPS